jgi:hypothetical protein
MDGRLCSVFAVEANVIRDRRDPMPNRPAEPDRRVEACSLSATSDFSATGAPDGVTGSAFSSPLCET